MILYLLAFVTAFLAVATAFSVDRAVFGQRKMSGEWMIGVLIVVAIFLYVLG